MKSFLVTLTKQHANYKQVDTNNITVHRYLCQYLACGNDINHAIFNAIKAANKEYPNEDSESDLNTWDIINSTDPTMNFVRSAFEVPPILNPDGKKNKTTKVFYTNLAL